MILRQTGMGRNERGCLVTAEEIKERKYAKLPRGLRAKVFFFAQSTMMTLLRESCAIRLALILLSLGNNLRNLED